MGVVVATFDQLVVGDPVKVPLRAICFPIALKVEGGRVGVILVDCGYEGRGGTFVSLVGLNGSFELRATSRTAGTDLTELQGLGRRPFVRLPDEGGRFVLG